LRSVFICFFLGLFSVPESASSLYFLEDVLANDQLSADA